MQKCSWVSGPSASHRCLGFSPLMSLCALGLDMTLGILHGEALQVISTMRFTLHRLYNSNICEFCVCNFGSLAPQNFTILWCPPRTRNYRGAKPKASLLQLPPSSCCDLGLQKGSLPPGTWNMPSLRVLTQLEASSSWRSTSPSPTGCSPVERISRTSLIRSVQEWNLDRLQALNCNRKGWWKAYSPRASELSPVRRTNVHIYQAPSILAIWPLSHAAGSILLLNP